MSDRSVGDHPSPGVYRGVKVIELAGGLSAPYATMFLADNGADVVKVEDGEGDPYRSDPGFQTVNRNKRSVVVDDATRQALIEAADVIVIDRPGQAERLRDVNATAVIVTMPPWGERGPMVDAPSSAALLHAATGIAWNQQSYAEVPVSVVVPIAHYGTGVLGALAAAAGLLVRAERGAAPTYEVSEVAGAAAVQLGDFRPAGDPPVRPGDSTMGSKGRVGCYRLVEAGDGKWFFLACGTPRFYERMLNVIGRPELIDDPDLANPPWGLMLDAAIERITPILDEAFAARPRHEWLDILAEADVPAQPVLTRAEFLETSLVAANEMDVTVQHPELGPVKMMGLPFSIESAPGRIERHAPLLGQHSDEVVEEWTSTQEPMADESASAQQPADRASAERPLDGVLAIDLASFIAGPVVTRHLAMLGAEVIKIEPPTGDPFRAIGPPFESWNQGKQSIILDLTQPEGQAVLHRMVVDADIVVENFRPGVADRLGADRDTLRAINPSLVFLSSPGYGLDETMAERPAFDPLVQALGGFMAAQGGVTSDPATEGEPGGSEPVFLSAPIHDVMTPMIGALGLVMALWQRRQTGEGQFVQTSLVQSTMVAQAAEYTRFAGRQPPIRGGFDHPGPDDEDTWHEVDGSIVWRDGDRETPVCAVGITGSELAADNGLWSTAESRDLGPIVVLGQLVGGAGPAPAPAPALDGEGAALRRRFQP